MKFGVVVFPGSNCDADLVHVIENVLDQEVEKIWHKQDHLNGFTTDDCILVPGGFSYGDYLRSGAIANLSPIMQAVKQFANDGGTVVGICNGFQILCEAGLLPGALLRNENQKFICKNVSLKVESSDSALTRNSKLNEVLTIPIAHAEGRYYADAETIKKLIENDQILFRYSSEDGQTDQDSNPNGSLENIAGICNEQRNVIGLMPHPERASEKILGNDDGLTMFESLIDSLMYNMKLLA